MVVGGLGSRWMARVCPRDRTPASHCHRLPGIPEPVAVIQGDGGGQGGRPIPTTQAYGAAPSPTPAGSTSAARGKRSTTGQGELEEGEAIAPGRVHLGKGGAVVLIGQLGPIHPGTRSAKAQQVGETTSGSPHISMLAAMAQEELLPLGARHRDHFERQLVESHAPGDGADPKPHVDIDRVDL